MSMLEQDRRIVLTLDAGGTSFRFFATRGGRTIAELPPQSSHADDLKKCLAGIVDGFAAIQAKCATPPVAISFAFPGPADYAAGIIGDLPNLPAFRGGVALGPMLEERFQLPVYVNNDGALFAYGEALAGFLPFVNNLLARTGSPRRYHNLLGVTLGTGFGGGIVCKGELILGDNSAAGHVWLLRNKWDRDAPADEGASIRAVRRVYAQFGNLEFDASPEPKAIAEIARGNAPGNRDAAREAFRRVGEVAGDAIAQALTVIDGVVVIGGGLAQSADLILPALLATLNRNYEHSAPPLRRLGPRALNLEDAEQRELFARGQPRNLSIPNSSRIIAHDDFPRTAVGLSCLGTSAAITLGAYAFALRRLDSAQ